MARFDGLPWASPWEFAAVAALLPFIFSGSLRRRLSGLLTSKGRRLPFAVLGITGLLIALKLVLVFAGTDKGFVGCYASTWQPPPQSCEKSYANYLERNAGATRIDEALDFGPTTTQASNLISAPDVPVFREGIASTDWNLSFANDLRFNESRDTTVSIHQLMPFAAAWRGTAHIPSDGDIQIVYAGSGNLDVGGVQISLPQSGSPRTVSAHVPPGNQRLEAHFQYEAIYNAPFAEFRVLSASGDAIAAASPGIAEMLAATLIWIIGALLFAGLALLVLATLGADLWLLGLVAAAALLAALLSGPGQFVPFQVLVAALAPILLWRNFRHPVLWSYAALLVIYTAGLLNLAPELGAVIYRASGSDFLTYESFAREIVLNHSLQGGENVFFYQPGSRYLLGLVHLLFGDGDVLVSVWSMLALTLPFAALIAWHRKRVHSLYGLIGVGIAGALLLAVLSSPTILSMVAISASEAPTWMLLPLAVAAPQLLPGKDWPWIGSAAAAALIWTMRNNQALAVGTILVAMGAAIGRERRRLLLSAGAIALVIALLPAIHNVAYGGDLRLSTTSMHHVQQIGITDLDQVFSDNSVGSQIRGHISAIFYDPPKPGLTEEGFGWLLWSLLAVWISSVIAAIALRKRRPLSLTNWLLVFLPVAYLAPHVIYQVEVYFPRHIIAGYLAMGVSAIGTFSALVQQSRQAASANAEGSSDATPVAA